MNAIINKHTFSRTIFKHLNLLLVLTFCEGKCEWPTPFSGTLPRPVLFVHGFGTDGYSTWGFKRPICSWPNISITNRNSIEVTYTVKCLNGAEFQNQKYTGSQEMYAIGNSRPYLMSNSELLFYKLNPIWAGRNLFTVVNSYWGDGIVEGYEDKSSMTEFVTKYNINYLADLNNIKFGINHNGIEVYNLSDVNSNGDIINKWQHPKDQSDVLYNKMVKVLDEYYTDWRVNPNRKIDLVAHSQGGLVIRGMVAKYKDNSTSNPIMHINHIVTINTPHLGSAFAHSSYGVKSVESLRDFVFWEAPKINVAALGGFVHQPLVQEDQLGPVMEIDNNAEQFMYPCEFTNPNWAPSSAYIRTTPIQINSNEPKVDLTVAATYSGPYDNKNYNYLKPIVGITSNYQPYVVGTSLTTFGDDNKWSTINSVTNRLGFEKEIYESRRPNCSVYQKELLENGYPKYPNGAKIPLTAIFGKMMQGKMVDLLEKNRETLREKCDEGVIWFITGDNISTGDCTKKVNELIDKSKVKVDVMDKDWIPNSDLVVDLSSQIGEGIFNEKIHPFKKVELVPEQNTDNLQYGIPHTSIEIENVVSLKGAAWHGKQLIQVLENKPKQRQLIQGVISLILN